MQMAMQLAWFRLNNSTVSTYESASTAAFLKGRTECIRSATMESKAFAAAFDNTKVSDAEKLQLLVAACTKHAAISKDCLLYTSDAADDLLCVDLGGRRLIKKKNDNHT
eukprot:TRINITY_DN2897_c0_g2_i1.p3 TRINITY_DN2897_c0_g2~~TRINITY_DN2897_c0_g2_i1.p3  ORF type:complete len:109 (+),score=50.84 TRINITY_DN2897_c0_g2_i1:274-600(+)